MQELLKITTSATGSQVVSARELYAFLESKKQFADWIKHRVKKYGLIENQDYTTFSLNSEKGRPEIEYALTLDAAKELAMVEGNDKGKTARQYFIECERRLKTQIRPLSQAEILLQSAQLLVSLEQRQNSIEAKQSEHDQKLLELEAKTATRPDTFTIMGFAILQGVHVSLSTAAQLGKKAKRICTEKGYTIDKIHDPRFGLVGVYPTEVLKVVFNQSFT